MKTNKTKQKHNTICVGHQHTQDTRRTQKKNHTYKKRKKKNHKKKPQHTIDSNHIKVQELIVSLLSPKKVINAYI